MKLEQVHTNPDVYAPYLLSQAIITGGFLFTSGQTAMGDDGEIVGKGDFDAQAEQAYRNLERVLNAGGSSLNSVVKVTVFITSMRHLPKMTELRRRWFSAPYPAETLVEISALYSPDAMIEIEAIAIVNSDLSEN